MTAKYCGLVEVAGVGELHLIVELNSEGALTIDSQALTMDIDADAEEDYGRIFGASIAGIWTPWVVGSTAEVDADFFTACPRFGSLGIEIA